MDSWKLGQEPRASGEFAKTPRSRPLHWIRPGQGSAPIPRPIRHAAFHHTIESMARKSELSSWLLIAGIGYLAIKALKSPTNGLGAAPAHFSAASLTSLFRSTPHVTQGPLRTNYGFGPSPDVTPEQAWNSFNNQKPSEAYPTIDTSRALTPQQAAALSQHLQAQPGYTPPAPVTGKQGYAKYLGPGQYAYSDVPLPGYYQAVIPA